MNGDTMDKSAWMTVVEQIDGGELEPVPWEPAPIDSPQGNAVVQLGSWEAAAKSVGWTVEQIQAVASRATQGDNDDLLAVLVIASDA